MKAARDQDHGAESDRFIPSVHNALHASVLNARLLLQAVLRHSLFGKQLGYTLRHRIIDSHANPSDLAL